MTPPTLIAVLLFTIALAGCSALEDEDPVPPELSWSTHQMKDGITEVTNVFRDTDWKWVRMEHQSGDCNVHLNGRLIEDGELFAPKGQPIKVGDRFTFDVPCQARGFYTEGEAYDVIRFQS